MVIDFNFEIQFSKEIEWNENRIKNWIINVLKIEKKKLGEIVYKFVSEKKIRDTNKKFLNHDYITDIITFDNSFMDRINGEIIICLEKVKKNSIIYAKGNVHNELLRVIIHGILHLCGYNDSSIKEKENMRMKENFYLEMY